MTSAQDSPPPGSPHEDVLEALHTVMKHELDRRILLELYRFGDELRWAELHRAAGEPSRQPYQDALERLQFHVLINKRLEPAGRQYRSLFSPTARGSGIAEVFLSLAEQGALPEDLSIDLRHAFKSEFLADHGHQVLA